LRAVLSGRHPGRDPPEGFDLEALPVADRFSDLGTITGRTAPLELVVGLHGGLSTILIRRSYHSAGAVLGRSGRARAAVFTFPIMAAHHS
jgi:hypothetical protein